MKKPAPVSMAEILAVLKAQGPMNSHELARLLGGTTKSIGGKMRIAERYGWCASGPVHWLKNVKSYSRQWQWKADIPVDFEPPAIFRRKATPESPAAVAARMTPEERRRKAEIDQDNDRWFAGLQAEVAARKTQRIAA